jgi:hypothetical protein
MLYLTKTPKGYLLKEYQGDSHIWQGKYKTLQESLKQAEKIMREEDIEYGLRLGKL